MKKKKVTSKKVTAIWAMGSASDPRWNRQGVYKVKVISSKNKVGLPPPNQMPAEAEQALRELEKTFGRKPEDFSFKVFPAHPHTHPHLPLQKHELGLAGFPPAETAKQESTLLRICRAVKKLDGVNKALEYPPPVDHAIDELKYAILDLCGLPDSGDWDPDEPNAPGVFVRDHFGDELDSFIEKMDDSQGARPLLEALARELRRQAGPTIVPDPRN